MAEDKSASDILNQLVERMDHLEEVTFYQISRIHEIEKRLGIEPEPLKTQEPAKQDEPPVIPEVIHPLPETPQPEELPLEETIPEAHKETITKDSLVGKRDIESMIGGNWFNRIGIFAIILSVGFFLKYAFDNQWIGPAGRVLIGAIVGIALLAWGERMQAGGYKFYAHGLSGGGIAILYLATFAAFERYNLIGQIPAFLLMSLITATAVLLASRYDSIAIAILGLIGGFLTPVLLSTGVDNQVGLFGYIILLDLGVLALAYIKKWNLLNYLAFFATVLMSAAWVVEWYSKEKLGTTIFFFTVLFLIFASFVVLQNVIRRRPVMAFDVILMLLNGGIFYSSCYGLMEEDQRLYLGLFTMAVSSFYLGLGYLTFRRNREDNYLLLTFLGLALLFLTLAVPVQFDQYWVTMAWAVEGTILIWIGLKANSNLTRYAALAVFAVAVIHWFQMDLPGQPPRAGEYFILLLNRRGASSLVMIASLAIAIRMVYNASDRIASLERNLFTGLCTFAAITSSIVWLSIDVHDYFEYEKYPFTMRVNAEPELWNTITRLDSFKNLIITAIWCLFSASMLRTGLRKSIYPLRIGALVLIILTAAKLVVTDSEYFTAPWRLLILNPPFIAYILLVAVTAFGYIGYRRTEITAIQERRPAMIGLLGMANLFALVALSLESNNYFNNQLSLVSGASVEWRNLYLAKQLSISVIWAVYGGAMLAAGIWRKNRVVRIMALAILGIVIIKVFLVDLSSLDRIYRIISFFVLGGVLLLVSYLYQRLMKAAVNVGDQALK